ncbi:AEG_G0006580.mRNA.1.CDS.1 [Saccharomyces cerevisiae]|nr:AEG_G0006580.mRNA.1.CDS.1 [Saccharomyces cerevisiae]CAI6527327.1 AEG_G0006580.mRNA.1.CDS.1 [Saccharomyces cerevisiae]
MNSFASLGLIYSVVNLLTRVEAQIVFYQNSSTSLPVSTLVSTSIADFHESSSTGEVQYSSSYSYVQPSIDSFTSSSFLTSFEAPTETSSSYAVSSSLITSDTFSSYSDIFDEETSSLISTSAASSEKASSTLSSTTQPHRTSHSSSSFELPVTAPSSSSLPSSTSLTFTSVNPSQSWTSFNSEKSSALSSTIDFTSSEISGSTSPKSLESFDTTGTITSSYSPSPSSKNSNQTSLLSPLEPLSSSSGDLILSSTIQATTNDQTSKTIPTLVDATSSLPPTLRSSSMAPTSGSDSISHNFTSPPSKTSGNYDVLTSNSIDPSLFTTTSEYSSTQLSSLNRASKSETVNFTASIASTPFGTDSATSLIDPISSVGSTASSFVGISSANFSTQGNSNYVPESTASGGSQYQDWSSSSLLLSQTTWVVINTTNTQGSVTSTTSPAYVSTATKTVDGVITEYVTWCPLTQTKSQAIGVSSSISSVPQASSFSGSSILSSNSSTPAASNDVPESTASGSSQYQDWSSSSLPLSQTTWVVINTTNTQGSVTSTTSPAYVSTATKTVDGVITEYVTWCPLTQTKSQAIGVSSSISSVPQASSFSGSSILSSNSSTPAASNDVPESTASGSSQYQDWSSSSLPLSQTTWVVINTTNTQGSVTSTTSPAYVSTATKTVDGVITEYVTWCPLTQTKSQTIGVSSSTISATETSKPSSILTLGISTLQLSDATFKGTETINTHLMTESTSITEPTYFSGTSDSFYLSTSEVNLASSLSSYPNFSSSEGSTATITNSTVTFGSTSQYPSTSVSNPTEASQHVSSSVNSLTDFTSNSTETIVVISNIHKTSSNKDYSLTTTQLKTSGMQTLVLSTVTTTVNGATTEYTTWCPATSITYTTSISYKTLLLTTEVCSHSECTPTVITSVTATSSTIPLLSTSSFTVLSSTVSEGTKNPAASEVTTNTQVSATSEATNTSTQVSATSVTATASESSTTSQVSATSEATNTSTQVSATSVTATASESSTTSQVSATSEATSTSTQVSATSVTATVSESSTTSQVSAASETISTLGTQNFTTTGSLLFPALSTEMINTTVVFRKTLIISTELCSHSKCVPTVITEVVTSKGTPSNGHSSQTLQTEAVEVTLSSHQTVTMSTEVCSNSICTPTVITSVQTRSTPSPYLTSSTSSSSLVSTKKSSLEASSEMSTFSVSTQSLPLAFTSSEKRSTTSVSQWSSTVLTNTIMSSSSNVISTNEKPSSTTSPYNFSSGYSLPSSSTPFQYSLSTATTTINGIKTVYTTWCPLAEKSTVAAFSQSSRSVDRFASSSKPSSSLSQTSIQYTLSTATTTISGLKTVYTTWCPLTSKSTLGATTQTSCAGKNCEQTSRTAKVSITSASSATSTSISLSTSTESESSSGYLSKGICSGTECTQDVPTQSSSPASTLAYSPSVSTSSSSFSTTTASTLTSTHTSVPLLPSTSSISASSPSSTSLLSTSLPSPAFTSSTLPTATAVSSSTFIASSLPLSSKSSLSLSPVSSSILMSQFSSSSSLSSLPSLSISPTVDTVSVLQPTTSIATLTCTDSQCQQEVSTICNGSNCDDVTSTATTPPSTVTDTMTCTGSECQKTTSSSCDGYSCKVSETYKSSATISACSGEGCQASATSELNSQYVTMTSVITPSAITTTSVEVHSTESTISITTVKPVTYTSSDTNGELITITSSSQTVIPSVTTIITRTKVAITSTPKPTTTTYVEQRLSSSGIATSFVAAASSTWITTPIVSTYAGSASKFLCSKFFMIMVMVINFI